MKLAAEMFQPGCCHGQQSVARGCECGVLPGQARSKLPHDKGRRAGGHLYAPAVEGVLGKGSHGLVVESRAGGDVGVEPVEADVGQQLVLAEAALHVPTAVTPRPELLHNPRHEPCTYGICTLYKYTLTPKKPYTPPSDQAVQHAVALAALMQTWIPIKERMSRPGDFTRQQGSLRALHINICTGLLRR